MRTIWTESEDNLIVFLQNDIPQVNENIKTPRWALRCILQNTYIVEYQ